MNIVILYGIGCEQDFLPWKQWLEENREHFLYIIEDDQAVWEHFWQTSLGQEMTLAKRLKSYFLETPLQLEATLKEILWDFSPLNFEPKVHPKYIERGERFLKSVCQIAAGILLTQSYFKDFGVKGVNNILFNLLHKRPKKLLSTLKSVFYNIPAIICGGGPSLDDKISFLQKCQERAFIFAGGAALNVLNFYSIVPHFAGGVDEDAPFWRFKGQERGEIPFIFRSSFSQQNFKEVHGPLILAGKEALDDELIDFFQDGFDGGWNVTTFLVSVASFLGCNPIIIVGVDLSFKGMRYAQGVYDKKGFEILEVEGQNGEKLYTQQDWLAARDWLSDFAHNNIAKRFFNLSDKGLAIPNVDFISEQKAFDDYLFKRQDLVGKIHHTLQQSTQFHDKNKERVKQLEKSLKNSQKLCRRICSSFFRKRAALKLREELAFELILEPIWKIYKHLFQREVSKDDTVPFNEELMQAVFFQNVTHQYLTVMQRLWKDMK